MNTLTQAIVSDGDTYQRRLVIARLERDGVSGEYIAAKWLDLARLQAVKELLQFGTRYSVAEIAATIVELSEYHASHIKEMEG